MKRLGNIFYELAPLIHNEHAANDREMEKMIWCHFVRRTHSFIQI